MGPRFLLVAFVFWTAACGRAGFFVNPFDGSVVTDAAGLGADATLMDVAGDPIGQPDGGVADVVPSDAATLSDAGFAPDTRQMDTGLPPLALLTRVRVFADQVLPAQQGVRVSVRVDNLSFERLDLVDVSLRFTRQNIDVGSFFVQRPQSGNATGVDAAQSVWLTFFLDVLPLATAGSVTIDAQVQVRSTTSGRVQFLNWARETDSVQIVVPLDLRVSTVDDEDDIATGPVTLAAAGGLGDLSFREAIILANAASGPQSIHFDPGLFAPGLERSIVIDPVLGELPPLRADGLSIDGSDVDVSIVGPAAQRMTGLRVQASGVTLCGFAIKTFGGDDAHCCVDAEQVDRLTLDRMSFDGCGFDGSLGAQVRIRGGADHLVLDSFFLDGPRDGIRLDDEPRRVLIQTSQFIRNHDDGLSISGTDIQILDCDFIDNKGEGIVVESFDRLLVRGSLLQGNGYYYGHAGVDLRGPGQDARIENNIFRGNMVFGLRLAENPIRGVWVASNRFESYTDGPIYLEPGTNEGVQPPQISVFDGQHVEGTVASDVDRIEIFDGRAGLLPITQISALAGLFSVDLSTTFSHVAAIGTTIGGSTSAFSGIVSPPTAPLVVSVTSDELDGGEDIVTVAQAGGPADLSLREAITIAANRLGADAITFDSLVFLPGVETSIAVGSDSDPPLGLPSLGDGDSLIAGASKPVLNGGTRLFSYRAALLTVDADAVRVQGLTFRNFLADGGRCLAIHGADLFIADNRLERCGTPGTGSGLYVFDLSLRATIDNNHFLYSRHGMNLYALKDSVIQNNRIEQSSDSCIYARNLDRNTFVDNHVGPCGADGVEVDASSDANTFVGLRVFACVRAGLATSSTALNSIVAFSSLVGNRWGVWIHRDTPQFLIQNSLMAYNREAGLWVETGQAVQEDHNLFFNNDDDGATGTRARSDGVAVALSDLLVDPGLTNWATGQMTPNASTIDQGIDLGYDRNGSVSGLFNGAAPDIGAIEQ